MKRLCRKLDDAAVLSKTPERLENSHLAGHEEDYYVDENGKMYSLRLSISGAESVGNGCRHRPV